MTNPPLVDEIRSALTDLADPVRGAGQQRYMKSSMPFLGVVVPTVRKVTRAVASQYTLSVQDIEDASRELFRDATYREERYAAMALTALPQARAALSLIPLHEWQAATGAWWDFTDEIAHRIATLLDAHPDETATVVRQWASADSMWLRRLSIISQLTRKDRTDLDLLAYSIERNAADKEFFIRKAIGWALRDLAKTNPEWVLAFADTHELSPLSRREALRCLM